MFLMDTVTYLIPAGKTTTMVVSARTNKNIFTGRHSAANTSGRNNRPNTTQQKRITCRSFHFSTDKPSTQDTILPKKIRKVTIQHQRRRGKKSPNPRGNQPKDREGKKKVPTTILLFPRLRIFLYKWEPNAEDYPTNPVQSRPIYGTQTLLQFVFKLAPNFQFSFGPTRDTPALSVFSFPEWEECVWVWDRKKIKHERFRWRRVVTIVIPSVDRTKMDA